MSSYRPNDTQKNRLGNSEVTHVTNLMYTPPFSNARKVEPNKGSLIEIFLTEQPRGFIVRGPCSMPEVIGFEVHTSSKCRNNSLPQLVHL